ncbi:His-Xaa-Ser system radical SAM maturase HxsC [Lachnoclostridium sp. Marseille-P6806]|uniref:His-Xaa-Ser system radical SAM maturase HxsC n=1 Tax=Lachnoclostridium sp. Marseille-P6806 TaxID=2364793 RepID=UPI0010322ED5|nr:His-Xaa-Ser system radical SAM maturase HxsC [Lachnoclostridium sp. Marseille-P6806]
MNIKLENFNGCGIFYSYTSSVLIAERMISDGRNVFFKNGQQCTLAPEGKNFPVSLDEALELNKLSEEDVLINVGRKRLDVIYEHASLDNTIVVTEACNSNCVMCPVPESVRRYDQGFTINELLDYVRYIPEDAEHITITGGEPFLVGEDIFKLFKALQQYHNNTEYLLLTNGRIFANLNYEQQFALSKPDNLTVGIPIHGYSAETHDEITQVPGSFMQTVLGIHHLVNDGINVEIRFVVSGLNHRFITKMSKLVVDQFPAIDSVKFMGLEMMGNAAVNQEKVWIPYELAFNDSKEGIDYLLTNGIDVELYNFPLCAVEQSYWGICRKSITGYKIRYQEQCNSCVVKDACGGLFEGTIRLVNTLKPVLFEK